MRTARPKILCVDDEPKVLEGLQLILGREFEMETATSGTEGLERIAANGGYAVIVSDMRMPGMDGAQFLRRAREETPDTVRLLLTGHSDMESAIAAVNEGHIFRFLTKPCPPPNLLAAVRGAVEQHDLVIAERVLLSQTLRGSIKMLIDVLSLTNPDAFGRATRIRQHVIDLAERLEPDDRWQVEVAAMLSQIGCITLPDETVAKLSRGGQLTEGEQKLVARLPAIAEQLLSNIPRLEAVREILATYPQPVSAARADKPADSVSAIGARMLRIATDYDRLESEGLAGDAALDTMRGRAGVYDPALLDQFAAVRGSAASTTYVREMALCDVQVGMVFAGDVHMKNGTLLVARGYEVTENFVERVSHFPPGCVKEPVRVVITVEAPAQPRPRETVGSLELELAAHANVRSSHHG